MYSTTPSYGTNVRIWVKRDTMLDKPLVWDALNRLSIWGGHDKDDGGLVSWEFKTTTVGEALLVVMVAGIEQGDVFVRRGA
jgi:hypothetical protein